MLTLPPTISPVVVVPPQQPVPMQADPWSAPLPESPPRTGDCSHVDHAVQGVVLQGVARQTASANTPPRRSARLAGRAPGAFSPDPQRTSVEGTSSVDGPVKVSRVLMARSKSGSVSTDIEDIIRRSEMQDLIDQVNANLESFSSRVLEDGSWAGHAQDGCCCIYTSAHSQQR